MGSNGWTLFFNDQNAFVFCLRKRGICRQQIILDIKTSWLNIEIGLFIYKTSLIFALDQLCHQLPEFHSFFGKAINVAMTFCNFFHKQIFTVRVYTLYKTPWNKNNKLMWPVSAIKLFFNVERKDTWILINTIMFRSFCTNYSAHNKNDYFCTLELSTLPI